MNHEQTRRQFLSGAVAAGALNFNPKMEYRRLGKTGLKVSSIGLGGHWKRVQVILRGKGVSDEFMDNVGSATNAEFLKNRHDVVSRCIDVGINYVDACTGGEVMTYAKVLKGRREKMYLGYSWYERESRKPEWCSAPRLLRSLDEGLRESGLDYVDLWRISLPLRELRSLDEYAVIEEGAIKALEQAQKQGKTRFRGVSAHNRVWLKSMVEQYPQQIDVVLFPFTAYTKEIEEHSLFDAVKRRDIGVFGIKPFADNSIFVGDSAPASPNAAEDDRRARLTLRYILGHPAVTAPIPGLVSLHQVDNAVLAVQERRRLDLKEKAELESLGRDTQARLRPDHQWLRDWEYV